MNPFAILDLPVTCSDREVRDAYEVMLHRYSPETDPETFQLINDAYQKLKTERARWQWLLFHRDPAVADTPLAALEKFANLPGRSRPPGKEAFWELIRGAAKAAQKAPKR